MRKERIFLRLMSHSLISEKYEIGEGEIPRSLNDGMRSEITIIKTIALIISELESKDRISDQALQNKVIRHLNTAI